MLMERVHKSTSASKREPQINAAYFCVYALLLMPRKCALLCCVSRLLSVLWSRGETALHKAACQRHRAVCQLLVDAGASLRKTDSKVRQLHQPPPSPVLSETLQHPPCCLHGWGFLVCAETHTRSLSLVCCSFEASYFYRENCIDLNKHKRLQSPARVTVTTVRAWPQTLWCSGC